jgi:hypothetical protein
VRVICAIAIKNCLPGRKATTDDHADAESRVNQNISAENTRFVALCLPILLDRQPVLDYACDPALPFYKYLKEGRGCVETSIHRSRKEYSFAREEMCIGYRNHASELHHVVSLSFVIFCDVL